MKRAVGVMDSQLSQVFGQVADEHDIDVGVLVRIYEAESQVAHLSRRHGIFDTLRDISRQAARREIESGSDS